MSPEQLLGELNGDRTVIADLEAGVGTLTRLPADSADVVLVVVEPTLKSIEVGRRVVALASSRHPRSRVLVVANRLAGPGDLERISAVLGEPVVAVPDDPAVQRADRRGAAPLDEDSTSPAMLAVTRLAHLLESHIAVGP